MCLFHLLEALLIIVLACVFGLSELVLVESLTVRGDILWKRVMVEVKVAHLRVEATITEGVTLQVVDQHLEAQVARTDLRLPDVLIVRRRVLQAVLLAVVRSPTHVHLMFVSAISHSLLLLLSSNRLSLNRKKERRRKRKSLRRLLFFALVLHTLRISSISCKTASWMVIPCRAIRGAGQLVRC